MGQAAILINKSTGEILKDSEYPRIDDGEIVGLNDNLQWLIKVPAEVPSYDATTQVASYEWVKDTANGLYVQTWTVRDKTEEELTAERESEAILEESNFDVATIKSLLVESADLKEETEQYKFATLYPAWRVGEALVSGNKRQYKAGLYKVVQSHTTQLDWTPDIVPALFTKVTAAGVIPVFVHPTGAQDVYMKGDKVHFPTISDPVYESLIDNNSFSPTEYAAGWVVV